MLAFGLRQTLDIPNLDILSFVDWFIFRTLLEKVRRNLKGFFPYLQLSYTISKWLLQTENKKFTLVVAVSCTHFPQPLLRNKNKLRLYLNSWLIWQYEFGNTIKASANFQRLRLVKIIYTTKRSKNVEVQCIELWPYCKGIVMRRIPSLIEAIQRLSYFIYKEDFQ